MTLKHTKSHKLNLLPKVTLLALASATMVLTGCNSSSETSKETQEIKDTKKEEQHTVEKVAPEGRLALLEKPTKAGDKPTLNMVDLKTGKTIKTLAVSSQATTTHSSPNKRYVLLADRAGNSLTFVDGGLYTEDHGDHDHPQAKSPKPIALKLDKVAPTHYQAFEGTGAVFFDGDRTTKPNKVSSVAVFTDDDIAKLTPKLFDLPNSMHGTAEPRGDFILTTVRNDGKNPALPDEVVLYKKEKTTYKQVSDFPKASCDGLHGSVSSKDYTLFGCTDGVLSVKQSGSTFTVAKIANTDDIKKIEAPKESNKRIGKLVAHPEKNVAIGTAFGLPFVINPKTKTMTKLAWAAEKGATVKTAAYDAHGEHIVLVDSKGKLHIHDAGTYASKSVIDLKIKANPVGHGSSEVIKMVMNGSHDEEANQAYVLDTYKVGEADNATYQSRLLTVDIEKATFTEKKLAKAVSSVSWVGIVSDEHDH